MCGIVGMAGEVTAQHEKVLRTLLVLDCIRGEDSTGIAVVPRATNNVKIAKQVGDPFQLFDHKSYDKALQGTHRCIIGHNRYATSGAVSRVTAHPFENDSFVGVHNGTLKNKWKLADANQFTVDSENLYHHMHLHGLHDLLATMDGAWALVWWDKQMESLNLLRNKERTLFYAMSKDEKVIFWASEYWMLHAALGRAGIDYTNVEILPEDTHVTISIGKDGKLSKPIARKAPGTYVLPPAPPVNNNTYWDPQKKVHVTRPAANNVCAITLKKEEPAVATQKKLEPSIAGARPCYDASYINAKDRTLELLSANKDHMKYSYISCFDASNEAFEIRLYAEDKSMLWEMIGEEITADICGWNAGNSIAGRGYYVVNPSKVALILPELDETIMGPAGKLITESEFHKQYSTCDYCSQPLEFAGGNRWTTGGECICPSCSKDEEVLKYVNLC
jgi:predicted glutamine amidotransferase